MAAHIILLPLDYGDLEELFTLLSSCPDPELKIALSEVIGKEPVDTDVAWHQAVTDYRPKMLREANELLDLARDELRIAEMRYQKLVKQIEDLQVLEDMARHARSTYESTTEQLARVYDYIDFASVSGSPELAEEAFPLRDKLLQRLQKWSNDYASELEVQVIDARELLEDCISLEDASNAVRKAQQAVAEAEERVRKLQ